MVVIAEPACIQVYPSHWVVLHHAMCMLPGGPTACLIECGAAEHIDAQANEAVGCARITRTWQLGGLGWIQTTSFGLHTTWGGGGA